LVKSRGFVHLVAHGLMQHHLNDVALHHCHV
jgi:hypothetical protein